MSVRGNRCTTTRRQIHQMTQTCIVSLNHFLSLFPFAFVSLSIIHTPVQTVVVPVRGWTGCVWTTPCHCRRARCLNALTSHCWSSLDPWSRTSLPDENIHTVTHWKCTTTRLRTLPVPERNCAVALNTRIDQHVETQPIVFHHKTSPHEPLDKLPPYLDLRFPCR